MILPPPPPLLPPLPLRPLLLLQQRFFLSAGLSGSSAPASLLFHLGAREEDRSANSSSAGAGVLIVCEPNSEPGQRCRRRTGCGSRARAWPAALRAWASRPRVPRCLTRASANQGVRPGCHVTGEAALFPSAARGRRGAEPALSLGAQRPRRRRRQAGAAAAAAQARGQPSAHPRHPALRRARRSAGAATREWTKQDGRDLSLVLERAVLASAQCHLGRPEEHGGSHLPAGGGPLPRLPRGLLHLHGAAHLREVRRAGAPALLHTRTQRAQSPAPWRTPPRSGSHLPTFVFTVGSPIPRPVWPLGS